MTRNRRDRRAYWWLLLPVAVGVAYWPAMNGGLLWDDSGHITRPDLQSLHGLWRIWAETGATQQYYPLLHSAFWLEHRLWGDAMFGYHLANVLLHSTAAILLFRILRELDVPGPMLAAFIFALHPVCVESVAWVSEQKNTLSAVFYLASALVYVRGAYWLAFALFLCALLTKTVTATLPAALLLIVWWKRGRLSWRTDVVPLVPWFAVAAAAGLHTAWFEREIIGARGEGFSLTILERILLAGRVIWFYLGKLVWPIDLMFWYPRWAIDAADWRQYLFPAAALGLTAALALLARRHRAPLAAFLFFCGTLVPVLGSSTSIHFASPMSPITFSIWRASASSFPPPPLWRRRAARSSRHEEAWPMPRLQSSSPHLAFSPGGNQRCTSMRKRCIANRRVAIRAPGSRTRISPRCW